MLSSPVDEIKNRLDIVDVVQGYLKLQKAGSNYRAPCPFHADKSPSFFVSPARQIWRCFGCGVGGNMFKFVMQIEGVEFKDALRILAQKAGVELKKQDPKLATERDHLSQILQLAVLFFARQLEESGAGKEAKQYLLKRGLTKESIAEWKIGYAPAMWQPLSDFLSSRGFQKEEIASAGLALKSEKTHNFYDRFRGRIMFPIFDIQGQVIGFGGRIFKESQRPDQQKEAKYVNTPNTLLYDKSKVLYGINKAGIEIRRRDSCVLVEGYTDVIMSHQTGATNIVSTSGTALTNFQLAILKRYTSNLFMAFDMDIGGDSATKRGIDLAHAAGFNVKIIMLEQSKDPADVIAENPQKWLEALEKSKSIHDFYFQSALERFDGKTVDGKRGVYKFLLPVIKRIPDKVERDLWVKSLAETVGAKEESILEELSKLKIEAIREDTLPADQEVVSVGRRNLLEERLMVMLIKLPELKSQIKEKDLEIITSVGRECLDQVVMIPFDPEKGPDSLRDKLNQLALASEIEILVGKDEVEAEFRECLGELHRLAIKDRLDNISRQTKEAEAKNDKELINQLAQEFNACSRLLTDLDHLKYGTEG